MSNRTLRTLIVGTSFLAGVSVTGSALAQMSFDPAVSFGVGNQPDSVAAGDYDGDGDADLAVTTDNPDKIDLLLNNGDGTYAAGGSVILPNSSSPGELIAADLDGDGDVDLAVVLRDFQQVMTVVNTGGGTFSLGATAPVGDRAIGMTAADHDGDGDIDLAVANRDANTATVLTNDGAGTFSSSTVNVGDEPRAAAFVDIDGDGLLDLAVSNHDSRSISLFRNSGGFSPAGTLSVGAQLRPEGISSADLNGDGRDDLAVATNGNGLNNATVFLNTGGAFGAPANYPTGGQDTSGIRIADFDCDGMPDLATRNTDSATISILPNLGGTFGAATQLGSGADPDGFIAADLDGDGDPDLAVANKSPNTVSVIINQTCEAGAVATLNTVDVVVGQLLAGGVAELGGSDDAYVQTRSGFGRTLTELHKMEMVVAASTSVQSPSTLSIVIEERIDEPSGSSRIALRNWSTGEFEQIDSHSIGQTDNATTIPGVAAAPYVNGAGEIELRAKHTVFAPFLAFQFESFIDQVEITIE